MHIRVVTQPSICQVETLVCDKIIDVSACDSHINVASALVFHWNIGGQWAILTYERHSLHVRSILWFDDFGYSSLWVIMPVIVFPLQAVKAEIKFEEPPKESLPPEPVKTESMDQDYRDKYKDYKDRDERREYADVDYRKQDKYDDRYLKEEDSSRDKYDDKYSRDRYSQRERSSSRAGSDRVKYEEPEAEVKREIRISSRTEESTEPQSGSSFEFYDAGNHWCRLCNVVGTNVYELFNHLQSKKHTQVCVKL